LIPESHAKVDRQVVAAAAGGVHVSVDANATRDQTVSADRLSSHFRTDTQFVRLRGFFFFFLTREAAIKKRGTYKLRLGPQQ